MRYIDINKVLSQIPAEVNAALSSKRHCLESVDSKTRDTIIEKGGTTWSTVKPCLEEASNKKCWYTESKNPGCTNDVDHFRPKTKYWFLAFEPENYRLSCQFSNRPNANSLYGQTGGKGDKFPHIDEQLRANEKTEIAAEKPILLDPCNQHDCVLLSFESDGRPRLSSAYSNDAGDLYRVEQSKLILNLDYPTFNEDRELLYRNIKELVDLGNMSGAASPARQYSERHLKNLMNEASEYSKAAECYVRCFRNNKWVEQLL